jgi:glutathione S-transferase
MSRPALWHIPVSHYSEKVRWALAFKGVEHRRHAPPPGGHIPVALALTRGRSVTFPVLTLDGRHIGDSTAVGDAFGVADLTAAALLYPFVLPQGAPLGPEMMAPELARLHDELGGPDRPAIRWVEAIYARHRRPGRDGTNGGHRGGRSGRRRACGA